MADQQQPADVAPAPGAGPCDVDDPDHDCDDGFWWSAADELEALSARQGQGRRALSLAPTLERQCRPLTPVGG